MNQRRNHGFTIIELMLAMSYVALLLLAIAMTTMEISRIYNKGITLKSVNQVGRDVSDDLQRSIAGAPPFDVPTHFIQQQQGGQVVGGRLCLGSYSYVWNYGVALAQNKQVNTYSGSDSSIPIHLVKVSDSGAALCVVSPTSSTYPPVTRTAATELLTGGDHDLVLHTFDLTQSQADAASNQALYAISMTLGTNDQTQLTSDNQSCQPPSQGQGNEDFCSVNRFDITARAGNRAGEQ